MIPYTKIQNVAEGAIWVISNVHIALNYGEIILLPNFLRGMLISEVSVKQHEELDIMCMNNPEMLES
jgi:hypothetical protein